MRKNIILLIIPLLCGCQTKVVIGKYENICYSTDAPSSILSLKKENKFLLIYPSSVEKVTGNWKTNQDTLILNSQFNASLVDKDSIPYTKKYLFLIKNKKLISLENRKCYLRLR